MDVLISGKRTRLDPSKSIGKGGEADIYLTQNFEAVKIFKGPTHADLIGLPQEQQAAKDRLQEHQRKLPAFPKNLPARVIVPQTLVTNVSGSQVVGYTMRFLSGFEVLLKYADRIFRKGIPQNRIPAILLDLHDTVGKIHKAGVVIGDFNNLNVMVQNEEAYIIDADSFQFGSFLSRAYTERYLDPLLADTKNAELTLMRPYQPNSDWYAYGVMLMECLLFAGPYAGIHIPKKPSDRMTAGERVFKRVTVFNPQVRYPKPAIPYSALPDNLLEEFRQVFEKDRRGEFPRELLEGLRWTKCDKCGTEHARNTCPNCKFAQAPVKTTVRVRGKVSSERIFQTLGTIVTTVVQGNEIKWVYHENGQFKRELGQPVLPHELEPTIRIRIKDGSTLVGRNNELIEIASDGRSTRRVTDLWNGIPVFDSTAERAYWLTNGNLKRDGKFGPESFGQTLSGQTMFWVGPELGLGFYRAGEIWTTFVFNSRSGGINDSVKTPRIPGQLIDAHCVFSKDMAWLMLIASDRRGVRHHCFAINNHGQVVAQITADPRTTHWLSNIHGPCAVGNSLLCPTDNGVVKIDLQGSSLVVTKEFPDTEPFCDSGSTLLAGPGGLYVVNPQEILLLKIT